MGKVHLKKMKKDTIFILESNELHMTQLQHFF